MLRYWNSDTDGLDGRKRAFIIKRSMLFFLSLSQNRKKFIGFSVTVCVNRLLNQMREKKASIGKWHEWSWKIENVFSMEILPWQTTKMSNNNNNNGKSKSNERQKTPQIRNHFENHRSITKIRCVTSRTAHNNKSSAFETVDAILASLDKKRNL